MAKKSNSEYWEERIGNRIWSTYNSAEDKNRELMEFYEDASKNIREELYRLAEKQSKDGVLSLSDMYKHDRLTKLNKRYANIIYELSQNVEELAAQNMNKGFKEIYSSVGEYMGYTDFAMSNKKLMEELLDRPWLGSNFSKRLWDNQKKLASGLNSMLLTGLQQGKTVVEIAVNLNNLMGKGFNAAHRLVRTESIHYLNSAALLRYKDSGIEKVQVWAAADERTCEHCMQYHSKVYDIDKAPILPLHANCRCVYLPVVDDVTEKMAAPAGEWKDTVPSKFSKDDTERLVRLAAEKNIVLYLDKFDGDIGILESMIKSLNQIQKQFPKAFKKKIALGFSDTMDPGDFAETRGKKITVNAFTMRKREITERNMQKAGIFSFSKVENIVVHEAGHIVSSVYGEKGIALAKEAYYNIYKKRLSNDTIVEYLADNISLYSTDYSGTKEDFIYRYNPKKYREITPEILAKSMEEQTPFISEYKKLLGGDKV